MPPHSAKPDSVFRDPQETDGLPLEPTLFEPSWDEVRGECAILARKLADVPVTTVLAVARGGLIPASIMAQMLRVSDVRACAFASYGEGLHAPRGALRCTVPPDPSLLSGDGVLVVDDLADTGQTMLQLARLLPGAVRCAPYAKPTGAPTLHLYSRQVPQHVWIKFPWEVN